MGKPKWWVCDDCKSLNDLPANKCYNCHSPKPARPTLMDDMYAEVGGQTRVGVTVDRSMIGQLTSSDPKESASPGTSLLDAEFARQGQGEDPTWAGVSEPPTASGQESALPGSRPDARDPSEPLPPPLREPARRSISAVGGRPWLEDEGPSRTSQPSAGGPSPAGVPSPAGGPWAGVPPAPGAAPPPGTPPPPGPPPPPGSPLPPRPGYPMSPPPPGMAGGPPAPVAPAGQPGAAPWPPRSPGVPPGPPSPGAQPGPPGPPRGLPTAPPGPPGSQGTPPDADDRS